MKIQVCDFCMNPINKTDRMHTLKHKFYKERLLYDTYYREKLEICDICWTEMSHYIIKRLSSKGTLQ